jgi:two-component system response regulator FixJ
VNSQHYVHIVDDDAEVRDSVQFLVESIDLQAFSYASADSFFESYKNLGPGCVILDLRMPGISGMEALKEMHRHEIYEPVIIMTGHGDVPVAVRSLKLGAFDFLEKPCNDHLLIEKTHKAIQLDVRNRGYRLQKIETQNALKSLSQRELGVLELLVEGNSNKEVARQLDISPKTIERHRANVMRKLDVGSFAELVQLVERSRPAY